jgi:hypothetical protein
MSTITEFEAARQQAEAIRLFLERLQGAETVLREAIVAQQCVDQWERTKERLAEEQAGLQLARNELEQEIADLKASKQAMLEDLAEEGTRVARQRVAELQDRLATLEQETLHAAGAFERETNARAERIAELMAEEDRLQKLCQKHRSQLGKIRAEVQRSLQDEEEQG